MQPYLICSGSVRFVNTSMQIDIEKNLKYKFYLDEKMEEVNFDEKEEFSDLKFETKEKANTNYYELPKFIQNERDLKQIEKDFSDYLYRNSKLTLYKIDSLKLSSKQEENLEDFKIRVQDRLNEKIDLEIEKLKNKYEKENSDFETKISKLYDKLDKEKEKLQPLQPIQF